MNGGFVDALARSKRNDHYTVKTNMENNQPHHTGAFIPAWLLCRREIGADAKVIYVALANYSTPDGVIVADCSALSAEAGIPLSGVHNALAVLAIVGLIEPRWSGANNQTVFLCVDHPWMHEEGAR